MNAGWTGKPIRCCWPPGWRWRCTAPTPVRAIAAATTGPPPRRAVETCHEAADPQNPVRPARRTAAPDRRHPGSGSGLAGRRRAPNAARLRPAAGDRAGRRPVPLGAQAAAPDFARPESPGTDPSRIAGRPAHRIRPTGPADPGLFPARATPDRRHRGTTARGAAIAPLFGRARTKRQPGHHHRPRGRHRVRQSQVRPGHRLCQCRGHRCQSAPAQIRPDFARTVRAAVADHHRRRRMARRIPQPAQGRHAVLGSGLDCAHPRRKRHHHPFRRDQGRHHSSQGHRVRAARQRIEIPQCLRDRRRRPVAGGQPRRAHPDRQPGGLQAVWLFAGRAAGVEGRRSGHGSRGQRRIAAHRVASAHRPSAPPQGRHGLSRRSLGSAFRLQGPPNHGRRHPRHDAAKARGAENRPAEPFLRRP